MSVRFNIYTCRRCDAWEQVYPENKQLGNCIRLPLIEASDGVIGLLPASDFREKPEPTRDIEVLRTNADFGCVSYLPASVPNAK